MSHLDFDAATHRYTLDGEPVPSVTGILQASGLIDFSGIPETTLDAARTRGSLVHQAVHFYNEGDLDVDAFRADFPDYAGYLDGWLSFCAQRRFVPVLCEHRVASPRHGVAGTLDALGLVDGGAAVLLDYATGDPADVAKDLQTAAYLGLAYEWAEHDDPALGLFLMAHPSIARYAVALRRDGTFKLEPYRDPRDFRQFLVLNDAQRIVRARRRRPALVETV